MNNNYVKSKQNVFAEYNEKRSSVDLSLVKEYKKNNMLWINAYWQWDNSLPYYSYLLDELTRNMYVLVQLVSDHD